MPKRPHSEDGDDHSDISEVSSDSTSAPDIHHAKQDNNIILQQPKIEMPSTPPLLQQKPAQPPVVVANARERDRTHCADSGHGCDGSAMYPSSSFVSATLRYKHFMYHQNVYILSERTKTIIQQLSPILTQ